MVRALTSLWLILICVLQLQAQRLPDHVYMNGIRTVKLFMQNNQSSMALLSLGGSDQLELHFDDFYAYPRNFYYTYQLCNADWTPADVNPFDYIKGFTQVRLSQYRQSTLTDSKYIHYQTLLPERNCMPAKSGNYLLKVYLDGDTSKLAFTKRLLVVDSRVSIGALVQQPFDNEIVRTHQKIQVVVNTQQLNILSPQQTHLVILQNNRWDDAIKDIQPTFFRQQSMEYNAEQDCIFPAGKEYRWADLQSFRFLSDRMDRVDKSVEPNEVFVKPDMERNNLRYLYFPDRNGYDEINSTEFANPWWQSAYAYVHFTFVPSRNQPYAGRSVYLLGELTGNQTGDTSRMQYDPANGVYRKTLLLKQGYYSYMYVTREDRNKNAVSDPSLTEGNYWETENQYTVLFYYRSFSSRHDELIGITTVNSQQARR
jgi:hypothetical protein